MWGRSGETASLTCLIVSRDMMAVLSKMEPKQYFSVLGRYLEAVRNCLIEGLKLR